MMAIRKFLGEKLACRYKPTTLELNQQKKEHQVQVDPPTMGLSLTQSKRNGQAPRAAIKKLSLTKVVFKELERAKSESDLPRKL